MCVVTCHLILAYSRVLSSCERRLCYCQNKGLRLDHPCSRPGWDRLAKSLGEILRLRSMVWDKWHRILLTPSGENGKIRRWNPRSGSDESRWNDESRGMTNSPSQKGGVPHTKEESHLEKDESHVRRRSPTVASRRSPNHAKRRSPKNLPYSPFLLRRVCPGSG